MKLYHGSSCVVQAPDVAKSRTNLDFGRGFYTTSVMTAKMESAEYCMLAPTNCGHNRAGNIVSGTC